MSCIKVALVYWLRKLNQGFDYNPMAYPWPINGLSMNSSLVHYFIGLQLRYLSGSSELSMTPRDLVYLCIVSRDVTSNLKHMMVQNVWNTTWLTLLDDVLYFNRKCKFKIRTQHSQHVITACHHWAFTVIYIYVKIYYKYHSCNERSSSSWLQMISIDNLSQQDIRLSRIWIKVMNVRNEQNR